jgi:death on curing protein
MRRLTLGELLEIAAAILDVDSHELARAARLDLAESALHAPNAGFGDTELYETLPEKAAILCSRIVKDHPFPDGNKRTGYISMIELAERNGYRFDDSDQDEIAETIELLAAGDLAEADFVDWADRHMSPDVAER